MKERLIRVYKGNLNRVSRDIMDTAKVNGELKLLTRKYAGGRWYKLNFLLKDVIASLQEVDKYFLEQDEINKAFILEIIGGEKQKSNNGHMNIHLKFKKKLVKETDSYYEFLEDDTEAK